MDAQRTIWCSACGTRLKLPTTVAIATPVRCARCTVVFPVPPMPPALSGHRLTGPTAAPRAGARIRRQEEEAHRPTPAGQFQITDLPTDLRAEVEATDPHTRIIDRTDEEATRPTPTIDSEAAERRAFDLNAANDPQRRTGAGLHRVVPTERDD
ncbi:MAG: hypothetical protein ACI9WU_001770 [Myxococcota bacterium]|jgi:hypothetical protein